MPTEREKMLAGELYDPMEAELVTGRNRARDLCQKLNATKEEETTLRRDLLSQLLAKGGDTVWIQPPFYCDYGQNIELGEKVFFNFNCIVLDVCRVTIGSYTLFGPGVQILTPLHPLNAELRRKQENGKPVTIGSRSVIGAGSVVTRDIPEGVFAAGNPCRVIKAIDKE